MGMSSTATLPSRGRIDDGTVVFERYEMESGP
jgi:hypothetical protein